MANIEKSIQDFLILPDWKKVELKINDQKYFTYPFMTNEEEYRRKEKIYQITSHYSKISFEDLTEHPDYTLDDTWPSILERFMTPKLLDFAPLDFWCQFGYCYCCTHWRGLKKTHFKLIARNKSNGPFPFSGICAAQRSKKDKRKRLIAKYTDCCSTWLPNRLYQSIYTVSIEKGLKNNKLYNLKDYQRDLSTINIWDYFFDKYSERLDKVSSDIPGYISGDPGRYIPDDEGVY